MKVQSTSSHPLLNGVATGSRSETPAHAASGAVGAASSAVALSPAARHLAALQDSDADVRAEQVRQIRDALASGELQINPERIADGLLASVRELLK